MHWNHSLMLLTQYIHILPTLCFLTIFSCTVSRSSWYLFIVLISIVNPVFLIAFAGLFCQIFSVAFYLAIFRMTLTFFHNCFGKSDGFYIVKKDECFSSKMFLCWSCRTQRFKPVNTSDTETKYKRVTHEPKTLIKTVKNDYLKIYQTTRKRFL